MLGQLENSRSRMCWNNHKAMTDNLLWGGTGMILQRRNANRQLPPFEPDPDNLGQWMSVQMRGSNRIVLQLVSLHVPHKHAPDPQKNKTVHSQHLHCLNSRQSAKTPCQCLCDVLSTQLTKCVGTWAFQGLPAVHAIASQSTSRPHKVCPSVLKQFHVFALNLQFHRTSVKDLKISLFSETLMLKPNQEDVKVDNN